MGSKESMAGKDFYFNVLYKTGKNQKQKTKEQILNSCVTFENRKIFNVLRGLLFWRSFQMHKLQEVIHTKICLCKVL